MKRNRIFTGLALLVAVISCSKAWFAPGPDNDGYPSDGKNAEWREYVKKLDFNMEFGDLDSTAVITYPCKAADMCPNNVVRFLVVPEKKRIRRRLGRHDQDR